VTELMAP